MTEVSEVSQAETDDLFLDTCELSEEGIESLERAAYYEAYDPYTGVDPTELNPVPQRVKQADGSWLDVPAYQWGITIQQCRCKMCLPCPHLAALCALHTTDTCDGHSTVQRFDGIRALERN